MDSVLDMGYRATEVSWDKVLSTNQEHTGQIWTFSHPSGEVLEIDNLIAMDWAVSPFKAHVFQALNPSVTYLELRSLRAS